MSWNRVTSARNLTVYVDPSNLVGRNYLLLFIAGVVGRIVLYWCGCTASVHIFRPHLHTYTYYVNAPTWRRRTVRLWHVLVPQGSPSHSAINKRIPYSTYVGNALLWISNRFRNTQIVKFSAYCARQSTPAELPYTWCVSENSYIYQIPWHPNPQFLTCPRTFYSTRYHYHNSMCHHETSSWNQNVLIAKFWSPDKCWHVLFFSSFKIAKLQTSWKTCDIFPLKFRVCQILEQLFSNLPNTTTYSMGEAWILCMLSKPWSATFTRNFQSFYNYQMKPWLMSQ